MGVLTAFENNNCGLQVQTQLARPDAREHSRRLMRWQGAVVAPLEGGSVEQAKSALDEIVEEFKDPKLLDALITQFPCIADIGDADGQAPPVKLTTDLHRDLQRYESRVTCALSRLTKTPGYKFDKEPYDAVLNKLQDIRDIRVKLWHLTRLLRDRDIKPVLQPAEMNERQEAIVRVLTKLHYADAHKRQNWVCVPLLTADGHSTGYYEPKQRIKDYLYCLGDRYKDVEMWDLLTAQAGTVQTVELYLTENNNLLEFPPLSVDHGCWSFRNGIYSASTDTFWPYGDPGMPVLTTVNFIDQPFVKIQEDWRSTTTPAFDSILDYQDLPQDVKDWVYALIGRSFFPLKTYDRWEAALFFQGVAGTGKSTIVDALYSKLFDKASIFTLSNNVETQFGLAQALQESAPYLVCCGSEIGKGFKLDQKEFQQMISGETMSLANKHGKPVVARWTLPLVLAGNNPPTYQDEAGSVARRLPVVRFRKPLQESDKDPQLPLKIEQEIPRLLQKFARAYREVLPLARRDFWDIVPGYFRESRQELKAATNALEAFMQSELVELDSGAFCQLTSFKTAAKAFATDEKLPRMELGDDALADVFKCYSVTVTRGNRKWMNSRVFGRWVNGLRVKGYPSSDV